MKEEKTIKRSIRQFARKLTILWRGRKRDKEEYKSVRRKLTTLWNEGEDDKTKHKDTVKVV